MDEQQMMSVSDQMKQMQMAEKQQEMMMRAQEHVKKMIRGYNSNPSAFSDSEAAQIKAMAAEVGIPFEAEPSTRRAVANGVFNALDTATLGLIPDSWGPEKLTTRDEVGSMLGGLVGFASPGYLGLKAGKMALAGSTNLSLKKGLNFLKVPKALGTEAGVMGEGGALFKLISKMKPGKAQDTALAALEKMYASSSGDTAQKIGEMLLRYNVPMTKFPAVRAAATYAGAMGANNFFGESPEEQPY